MMCCLRKKLPRLWSRVFEIDDTHTILKKKNLVLVIIVSLLDLFLGFCCNMLFVVPFVMMSFLSWLKEVKSFTTKFFFSEFKVLPFIRINS